MHCNLFYRELILYKSPYKNKLLFEFEEHFRKFNSKRNRFKVALQTTNVTRTILQKLTIEI